MCNSRWMSTTHMEHMISWASRVITAQCKIQMITMIQWTRFKCNLMSQFIDFQQARPRKPQSYTSLNYDPPTDRWIVELLAQLKIGTRFCPKSWQKVKDKVPWPSISCQKFPQRRCRPPLNIIENNFIKSVIAQGTPPILLILTLNNETA